MANFKKEVDFGLDNFQRQRVLSINQSIAQIIINLFFMRPGNIPSLPHIGINIKQYLYNLEYGIDVDGLKENIYKQCPALIPYLNMGEVKVFVADYKGQGILMVSIPILTDNTTLLLGFTKNNSGDILFNYNIEEGINNI